MARVTSIGELRDDGSILLYDDNVKFRQDFTTPRRIRPSTQQKLKMDEWGLQWVTSSFISGIGRQDNDLYIRFWNGSYYVYYGFGSHYERMLKSNSKGRYFWRNIRKTKRYDKIGTLPFPDDSQASDEELFQALANQQNQIVKMMYEKGVSSVVLDPRTQNEFLKIVYRGETIFLAINNVS